MQLGGILLSARENDLIKAEDMFRKSLEWRKKEDISNICAWKPPPSYSTDFQCYISGADNEGRPGQNNLAFVANYELATPRFL